eukprot:Hpha_TRINITY_DN2017_c0_g1::TRINITY_DN2017_c0_g1_i1::g.82840::m.82840/K19199/SETD3; histone-lysine N-methyltransferase SETD3
MSFNDAVTALPIPEMGGGVGIVATKDLAVGAIVASAPPSMFFNTLVAREVPELSAAFALECCSELVPLQRLVLLLARENADPQSRWAPWLRRLPREYDTMLEARPEEVELLHSRRRVDKVLMEQRAIADLHAKSCTAMTAAAGKVEGGAESLRRLAELTLPEWRRWYCSVCSRGFYADIDPARGDVWKMIPWMDYFNYTTGEGHRVGVDKISGRFEVTLDSPVAAGEQVMLHYGSYPDFELLLWYGFALEDQNLNQMYKISPQANASGNIPEEEWMGEVLKVLAKGPPELGEGCWAELKQSHWGGLLQHWATKTIPSVERYADADWHLAMSAKGPTVSSNMMYGLRRLAAASGAAIGSTTHTARTASLLRCFCVGELALNWSTPPPKAPSAPSPAAKGALSLSRREKAILDTLCAMSTEALVDAVASAPAPNVWDGDPAEEVFKP